MSSQLSIIHLFFWCYAIKQCNASKNCDWLSFSFKLAFSPYAPLSPLPYLPRSPFFKRFALRCEKSWLTNKKYKHIFMAYLSEKMKNSHKIAALKIHFFYQKVLSIKSFSQFQTVNEINRNKNYLYLIIVSNRVCLSHLAINLFS